MASRKTTVVEPQVLNREVGKYLTGTEYARLSTISSSQNRSNPFGLTYCCAKSKNGLECANVLEQPTTDQNRLCQAFCRKHSKEIVKNAIKIKTKESPALFLATPITGTRQRQLHNSQSIFLQLGASRAIYQVTFDWKYHRTHFLDIKITAKEPTALAEIRTFKSEMKEKYEEQKETEGKTFEYNFESDAPWLANIVRELFPLMSTYVQPSPDSFTIRGSFKTQIDVNNAVFRIYNLFPGAVEEMVKPWIQPVLSTYCKEKEENKSFSSKKHKKV